MLDIGHDWNQLEAIPLSPLACPPRRAQRDVRGDDPRAGPRQVLGVHAGAGADGQDGRPGEHLAQTGGAPPKLLGQQPPVELGSAMRAVDLELGRLVAIGERGLLPLVLMAVHVFQLVVLGGLLIEQEHRDAILDRIHTPAAGATALALARGKLVVAGRAGQQRQQITHRLPLN